MSFGGGFGLPLFNFFPPFFYLTALFFSRLGFSLVGALKLAVFTFYFLGGWGVYRLLREFFPKNWSLLGGTLFLTAPFLALEIFVRGDFAELAAFCLAPWVFWFLYRLTKSSWFWFLGATLGLSAFWLTHNPQTVIFTPFFFLWAIFWAVKTRRFWPFFACFGFAFGLSAFFLLPAWFEKNLVQINTVKEGYFDFHYHFATWRQLFGRYWGFGVSGPGVETDFSLQLGWPHWWALILLPLALKFSSSSRRRWLILLFVFWLAVVGLTLGRSLFFWEHLPLLAFLQFPWRFLGLAVFLTAVLNVFIFYQIFPRVKFLPFGLIALSLILNLGYFSPEKRILDNKNSDWEAFWQEQKLASAGDYLPSGAKFPLSFSPRPFFVQGEGTIKDFWQQSAYFEVNLEVSSDTAVLTLPFYDFPFWEVFLDQHLKTVDVLVPAVLAKDEFGLLTISLTKGEHRLTGWRRSTPLEQKANALSFLSLGLFWGLLCFLPTEKDDKKRL